MDGVTISLLSASSSAAETGMAAVTGGITSLGTLMSSVVTMVTGNELLVVFVAVGFVSLGWGLFNKFRHR